MCTKLYFLKAGLLVIITRLQIVLIGREVSLDPKYKPSSSKYGKTIQIDIMGETLWKVKFILFQKLSYIRMK